MENAINNKNNDAIDIMKFIASILVVALHTDAFINVNAYLFNFVCNGFSRLAVPLFFISSAYFLYLPNPNKLSKDRALNYAKRIAILYLSWFIISLPITFFNKLYLNTYPLGERIFRYLRSFIFSGGFSGAWYLTACIFCSLLFYHIDTKENSKFLYKVLVIFSIVFYLFCVLTSSYNSLLDLLKVRRIYDIYELLFCQPYLSIFIGIPYFLMGRFFASNREYKPSILLVFLIFALFLLEVFCVMRFSLGDIVNHYLLLAPLTFVLFAKIRLLPLKFRYSRNLRKSSTIIYLSQFLIIFLVEFIEWFFKISFNQTEKFLLVIITSFALSEIIINLQKVKTFNWLKIFY